MEYTEIEKLIADNLLEEALAALNSEILGNHADARLYFLRGKVNWRLDRRGEAITDYEHAVALDPESEAAAALELSRGIMDFYNPDMFNP